EGSRGEEVSAARAGVWNDLPSRPRPAVWCWVTSPVPAGAPCRAWASSSVLVDPSDGTTWPLVHSAPGWTRAWWSTCWSRGGLLRSEWSEEGIVPFKQRRSRLPPQGEGGFAMELPQLGAHPVFWSPAATPLTESSRSR